jgi:hypothetical protein
LLRGTGEQQTSLGFLQSGAMRRLLAELGCKVNQADAVAPLELGFTDAVLFHVMIWGRG